jgi:Zn-dependent protease
MLRWSINLFRLFGIQLAVHVSFLLLIGYYAWEGWLVGRLPGMLWSVTLILLFFVCVVLHELGHSLTAMRYGVRVPRILLMPIGGMAEFDRIPRRPSAELLITLAGPAVNFLIAALLFPLCWVALRGMLNDVAPAEYSLADLGTQLLLANLIMGTFNLLPIFPMDGGRILRAMLALKLDYVRATFWAANIGKALALLFALLAGFYFHHYLLAVLFLFIYSAGDAEYRQLLQREQEARYWAEMARRVGQPDESGAEPPPPPLIIHGPN